MKRLAWMIMPVFFLFAGGAAAQSQKMGITAGVNMSQFNGVGNVSTKNGVIVGGFVEYDFVGGISLQPELLFSMKGASGTYTRNQLSLQPSPVVSGEQYDWVLNYVEIPVLIKFNVLSMPILPFGVDLYAGPDFAFNVASQNKTTLGDITTTTNQAGNTRPFDFNILVGGGPNLDLGFTTLGVEVRYTFGTGSVFKAENLEAPSSDTKNGVWSIMASAAF